MELWDCRNNFEMETRPNRHYRNDKTSGETIVRKNLTRPVDPAVVPWLFEGDLKESYVPIHLTSIKCRVFK